MIEDIESIMSEGPGGYEPSEDEFAAGGFSVVIPSRGGSESAGMTAHRGVLHPDEYVDKDVLRAEAEELLGFTYADVSAAYARGGRLTAETRQLREQIDVRLLALSRSGAAMETMAGVLGIARATLYKALARAREVEVVPQVPTAVVHEELMCFKTGEYGARRRRRMHEGCPSWMLPAEEYRYSTINLRDEAYV